MVTFGVEQLVADGAFGCGIVSGVIRRDGESYTVTDDGDEDLVGDVSAV